MPTINERIAEAMSIIIPMITAITTSAGTLYLFEQTSMPFAHEVTLVVFVVTAWKSYTGQMSI